LSDYKRNKSNRLIKEKSPYLLQHAYNPVDWYPWGEEAFQKAKKMDKPIFLSIGYATCHWCHVMEKESFENREIADLLNNAFICIKVDREERPDIDNIYMTITQMMTGSGGWPNTIIMTPEKKPFFAATYIPKESKWGRMGLKELIPQIIDFYKKNRKEVENEASKLILSLKRDPINISGYKLEEEVLHLNYKMLLEIFDDKSGGFGSSPKFPTPHKLLFLLRYYKRTKLEKALYMVEKTLQEMRKGGIYDQIGFGFHRYSTDSKWFLPHFEKMLYDQALISMAYIESYQLTRKSEYSKTAKEIFTYVLRDMTSTDGAFFSAEDADSEGEEGKFYVWSEKELTEILLSSEAELIIKVFNVSSAGNFRNEATRLITGRNILYLQKNIKDFAKDLNQSEDKLRDNIEEIRKKILKIREKRIRPLKDDKILVDWNGLMIASLAKAARVFNSKEYENAAKKAVNFILNRMRMKNGGLYHRYRDNEVAIPGFLDDYAFLIWGLLELYETTYDIKFLKEAINLNNYVIAHFWDHADGGFYFTDDQLEEVLIRKKEIYDGAVPSGNSVQMLNLIRLAKILNVTDLEEKAKKIGDAFSLVISQNPIAYSQAMIALDFMLDPSREIIITGDFNSTDTSRIIDIINLEYIPNKVLVFISENNKNEITSVLGEFINNFEITKGKTIVYICSNYSCKKLTSNPEEIIKALKN
jgi:uncharacterized protein YyaL (SSP411 family)